jgi:hypothetical protein
MQEEDKTFYKSLSRKYPEVGRVKVCGFGLWFVVVRRLLDYEKQGFAGLDRSFELLSEPKQTPPELTTQKYLRLITCLALLSSVIFALSKDGGPNVPIALFPKPNPSFGIPTTFVSNSPFSFSS